MLLVLSNRVERGILKTLTQRIYLARLKISPAGIDKRDEAEYFGANPAKIIQFY